MRMLPVLVAVAGALAFAACSDGEEKTPQAAGSPSAATSPSATASRPAASASPSVAASPSASPSGTAAASGTATAEASPSPTATSQSAATPTATQPAASTPTATQPPAPTPTPTDAPAPPGPVTIVVTASNLSFDRSSIRVRSGQTVTLVMNNADDGVNHNLTLTVPGQNDPETCTGPCQAVRSFTAPAAGSYSFFCNIHGQMFGDFIVDP